MWFELVIFTILYAIYLGQIEYSNRDFYEAPLVQTSSNAATTTTTSSSTTEAVELDLTKRCSNETFIVGKVLNLSVYNKHRLPDANGVDVRVEFWIQVSEITSDFEADLYISELWTDPALRYEHLNPCKKNLSFSSAIHSRIWSPNNVFVDSKSANIHESPFKNVFLMIYPNGTGPCLMDLSKLPMDEQKCHLTYESFSYNTDAVRLRWVDIERPAFELKTIKLPDYELTNISAEYIKQVFPAGNWDDLKVTFTFKRRYIWYFLQAYLPTYLTIFISWISFALGSRSIPARTMIGVNALLAMIFQFGNIMRNLPRVSYVKAIDVWLLGSMTFVFASLLELAVVGYLTRDWPLSATSDRKRSTTATLMEKSRIHELQVIRYSSIPSHNNDSSKGVLSQFALKFFPVIWGPDEIDKISSVMFPFAFLVFNVVYWGFYLFV